MQDRRLVKIEKQKRSSLPHLLLLLFIVLCLSNCKYDDSYKKGLEEGKRIGRQEAQPAWYQKGKDEGFNEGYEQGFNRGEEEGEKKGFRAGEEAGYKKGKEAGYKAGFEAGEKQGYWKGTKAFLGKWWKPALGFVILFLGAAFIIAVIFLLSWKRAKSCTQGVVKTIEFFIFSIRMERVLKDEEKTKWNEY